jgi:hypothetical protein
LSCSSRAQATADEIRAWANERLGKTQRLAGVEIRDVLPRSAIGKVLKRELRDQYAQAVSSSDARMLACRPNPAHRRTVAALMDSLGRAAVGASRALARASTATKNAALAAAAAEIRKQRTAILEPIAAICRRRGSARCPTR